MDSRPGELWIRWGLRQREQVPVVVEEANHIVLYSCLSVNTCHASSFAPLEVHGCDELAAMTTCEPG